MSRAPTWARGSASEGEERTRTVVTRHRTGEVASERGKQRAIGPVPGNWFDDQAHAIIAKLRAWVLGSDPKSKSGNGAFARASGLWTAARVAVSCAPDEDGGAIARRS